jgi:hypothetical protein
MGFPRSAAMARRPRVGQHGDDDQAHRDRRAPREQPLPQRELLPVAVYESERQRLVEEAQQERGAEHPVQQHVVRAGHRQEMRDGEDRDQQSEIVKSMVRAWVRARPSTHTDRGVADACQQLRHFTRRCRPLASAPTHVDGRASSSTGTTADGARAPAHRGPHLTPRGQAAPGAPVPFVLGALSAGAVLRLRLCKQRRNQCPDREDLSVAGLRP